MYQEGQANKQKDVGVLVGPGSGYGGNGATAVAIPISPVRTQMQRQQELLSELRHQNNRLCDALLPVMARDPRDPVPVNPNVTGIGPVCDFERELMVQNEQLQDGVQRLREINDAIRL